jgi:hypothetical protein
MIDMLSALRDLAGDVVSIQRADGRDLFGTTGHGVATTHTAHVMHKRRELRSADGKTTVEQGKVWFLTTVEVSNEDRIVMPDGSTPLVVDVSTHHDEAGASFTVVGFGGDR